MSPGCQPHKQDNPLYKPPSWKSAAFLRLGTASPAWLVKAQGPLLCTFNESVKVVVICAHYNDHLLIPNPNGNRHSLHVHLLWGHCLSWILSTPWAWKDPTILSPFLPTASPSWWTSVVVEPSVIRMKLKLWDIMMCLNSLFALQDHILEPKLHDCWGGQSCSQPKQPKCESKPKKLQ